MLANPSHERLMALHLTGMAKALTISCASPISRRSPSSSGSAS